MRIVGICRFSLVGRGDWKPWRMVPPGDEARVLEEQAAVLFSPERLAARFALFQHVTLPSIAGQTDPDFNFLVLASELMPAAFRDRLQALCDTVPQVVLRFFPATTVGEAQARVFAEMGFRHGETVQFRLDDDDALFAGYVARLRSSAALLMAGPDPFAISFPDVMFAHVPDRTAYLRSQPFLGAGLALRHPKASIFRFGHFAIGRRFPALTLPSGLSLVTRHGLNDSLFDRHARALKPLTPDETQRHVARFFPFLAPEGLRVAGLG